MLVLSLIGMPNESKRALYLCIIVLRLTRARRIRLRRDQFPDDQLPERALDVLNNKHQKQAAQDENRVRKLSQISTIAEGYTIPSTVSLEKNKRN